jgi:CheY-like chemotaxis protein
MPSEKPSFAQAMGRKNKKTDVDDGAFTILIAEDNDVNLKVMQALLSKFDAKLILAKDGRKAVSLFRTRKIDLILMDINMPLMDGLEATKEIRVIERENGAAQTPIVAVTAHVKPADQHVCIAASMNDYLHKPVKDDDLKRTFQIWAPGLSFARPAKDAGAVSAA